MSGVVYECGVCGWSYDEAAGDPDIGIPPGTKFEDLPADWTCPACGVGKDEFERIGHDSAPAPVSTAPKPTAPILIVGSGLAGYTLVREIRARSPDVPILVLTADGGEVYTKPMLSNAFAKGHAPDDLVRRSASAFAAENGIEVRKRIRVVAIDRVGKAARTDKGETIAYDKLILALGADPRVFPVEGTDTVGVAAVNDLDDYRRWRDRIGSSGRILLIGAGLIGCEFADDLTGAGFEVSVVDPGPRPLARLLPPEIAADLVSALTARGACFHMGRAVARYQVADKGFVAVLDDGGTIAFDHALSAVGLRPRTQLAAEAGLAVKAGILVDRGLATSDPAIFALGDCAETVVGPLPFIAPLLIEAEVLADRLTGGSRTLAFPVMPVVVKTPSLPLSVASPPPGLFGDWTAKRVEGGVEALLKTAEGRVIGYALSGTATVRAKELAVGLPAPLPPETPAAPVVDKPVVHVCDICGWTYDPATGDPDNGVPPGTAWEDVPEGWECPVCGAGKDAFTLA